MTAVDDQVSLEQLAGRVDVALARVNELPAPVQVVAAELKEALDALHRAGLARIVSDLRADPRGRELLFALVEAPEVMTLLQMHGLVRPPPLEPRVHLAFDGLRSQGLEGEVVSVVEGVASLRLPGATGCSGAEMKDRVRRTLLAQVPGLDDVVVLDPPRAPTLVPLTALTVRGAAPWIDGPERIGVLPGQLRRVPLGIASAVVLVHGGRLVAWMNACPRQGEPLDGGRLDAVEGTITCSGHGLEFDALTGVAVSVPGLELTAVSVREHEGRVQLRAAKDTP